jgi:hypothetical protein
VRIEHVRYDRAPDAAITVQWANGAADQGQQLERCGVTLSGSNTLSVGGVGAPGGGGVGVVGGVGGGQPDRTIDNGETLDVAFAEPAIGVAYQMSSNFYVTVAGGVEFDLDAFGSGDVADVGSAHIKTDQLGVDLSDFFDDAPLSGFEIVSSAGGSDGQQLGSVTWRLPEPGYAASGFATVATLACLVRRRRPAGS